MDVLDLIKRCIRILHIARKPTPDEYEKVAKVTAVGMILIGLIGVVSSVVFTVI